MPDAPVHPAIQRVLDAAARKGVTLEVTSFSESTHTAADAAAALGTELGQIVKSLVFVVDGEDGPAPLVCLVSGPNRVDVARLAAVTGESDVRRASAREAHDLTGFSIGGIPPIGHLRPTRVIMDPDLGRYPVVWAAAGLPTAVFPVPPGTLRILSNATVAPITEVRPRGRSRRRRPGAAAAGRRLSTDGASAGDDRTRERHRHLPGRPARPLAMGRQRIGSGGLRPVRGRRQSRRPRRPGGGRPRPAVPGRAAARGARAAPGPPASRRSSTTCRGRSTGIPPACSSSATASTPSASRSASGDVRWEHRSATPLIALLGSSRLSHVLVQSELETFAIEPDGTVAWRVAHSDVVTAVELVGGRLVLTGFGGQLSAIDPATGRAPTG